MVKVQEITPCSIGRYIYASHVFKDLSSPVYNCSTSSTDTTGRYNAARITCHFRGSTDDLTEVSMRGTKSIILTFSIVISLVLTVPLFSEDKFPARQGLINDFADVIQQDAKKEMEIRVQEVLQKTGTTVVVATMPTIGENYLQGYVNDLYHTWGIGKKGENKGVLIFVAIKERKIRIETGYGVEGILPDGKVGEIIRNEMMPYLEKGDYGTGILNAVKNIAEVIATDAKVNLNGQTSAVTRSNTAVKKSNELSITAISIIAFIVVGIIGLITWAILKFGRRSYSSTPAYSSGFSSSSSDSSSSNSDSGYEGGDSGGGGADSDY